VRHIHKQSLIMNKNKFYCFHVALAIALGIQAQQTSIPTANDYLEANKKTDATVNFNTQDEGKKTPVIWGLDTAWPSEDNIRRGVNHIGKEYLGTGRVSFQPSDLIDENGELSKNQKSYLNERLRLIGLSGVKNIALNCDHEVLCSYDNAEQHRKNYVGKPAEWIRLFKATVTYCRDKGFNVVSIAPFNEADFSNWNQGSMADFKEICRLAKADPFFDGIRISGGNTLNCDEALKWYNGLSPYIDEGNTHQLAGSFDNYAKFFTTVRANGHYATADELHNVMEAMVGVEYGMQTGIWWGYDGRARGEYCQATFGERIGYAEDRTHWTAASVYRMPNGNIQAFGGTSERQANNSSYRFVSEDRVAYFDGYGPTNEYIMTLPGGTGYQVGQTNAERTFEIHIGEDVPLSPINGRYLIMNKKSRKLIMPQNGSTANNTSIRQGAKKTNATYQQWDITPVDSRVGGDFSYFYISNAKNGAQMDVNNWSTSNGGGIILINGGKGANEQWYFKYAGDGYYYIVSRHSGKYLEVSGGSSTENAAILQQAPNGKPQQLWRLLPINASAEIKAPQAPTGLTATPQTASIQLSWNANTESDLASYMILRSKHNGNAAHEWDVIGRNIEDTIFIDNTVTPYQAYAYKIKAVDQSTNRSESSDSIIATTLAKKALVAQYWFEDTLADNSINRLDCVHYGSESYITGKSGKRAINLDGSSDYLRLPTAIANHQEMTITTWLRLKSTNNWQRIFDFGNNEDEYMFLTTNAGTGNMRFTIKNGGEEQILEGTRLSSQTWRHIALTISNDSIVLYINGEKKALSNDITIRPSDFSPKFNYIGKSQFKNDANLKGDIDDFRIYNYALTADEIQQVIENGTTNIEKPQTIVTVARIIYYTLDGVGHDMPQNGLNIVKKTYSNGDVTVEKILHTIQ